MVPGAVVVLCWVKWKKLEGIGGSWRLEERSVRVGASIVREQGQGSKCVESNRQLKKQNKINVLSRNCIDYFHSYPKCVHGDPGKVLMQVLTTYNAIAPVQQHRAGKLLQHIELSVHDIAGLSDLHQTPADPGTSRSAPPQLQS
jgi:hypothetical protein